MPWQLVRQCRPSCCCWGHHNRQTQAAMLLTQHDSQHRELLQAYATTAHDAHYFNCQRRIQNRTSTVYNTLQWARTHCSQQKLQLLRYGTHKLHADRQAGPRQQPCRHNQRNTGYAIWGAEQGTAAALAHTQHSTARQRSASYAEPEVKSGTGASRVCATPHTLVINGNNQRHPLHFLLLFITI